MIRKLCLFILFLALIYINSCLFVVSSTSAQGAVMLKAGVGKYHFSASGIVSPYASVVMTTSSIFMASAVADDKGNFALDPVLVTEGFTSFCLEAVDLRRIGSSYTCFQIEPVKADFEKESLFLPPTVGLSGRKIVPNSSITASGYSMPEAQVKVNVGDGITIEANSDVSGYYNAQIQDVPKGTYELYATAKYEKKDSEKPTKTFKIEALGITSSVPVMALIGLFVLVVLVVIILLIILLKRRKVGAGKNRKPNRFRAIFSSRA